MERRLMSLIDYGVIGNGEVVETTLLQQAIDDCHANGGGRVVIETGMTILTSTLYLKENVELHLELGAEIKGVTGYENYPTLNEPGTGVYKALIYAKDQNNIHITGHGKINGNGQSFVVEDLQYIYALKGEPRVTLMYIENCKNLVISDITIYNCAYWTIHPAGCDGVYIHGIKILQDLKMPNADGIDPDHCKNVIIKGCHIESGDDCIVLKNTHYNSEYGGTNNVVVSDCVLISTSAGFKIGTESHGDFNNITVSNCVISDSNRGLSIQLRDTGNVSNVNFSNIIINTRRFHDKWWGKGEPIAITAYPRDSTVEVGTINNIMLSNIICNSENAIFIAGEQGKISDIYLNHIVHEVKIHSKWTEHFYDRRPSMGEEHAGLFKGELVGMYTSNISRLWIKDYIFKNKDMPKYNEEHTDDHCTSVR